MRRGREGMKGARARGPRTTHRGRGAGTRRDKLLLQRAKSRRPPPLSPRFPIHAHKTERSRPHACNWRRAGGSLGRGERRERGEKRDGTSDKGSCCARAPPTSSRRSAPANPEEQPPTLTWPPLPRRLRAPSPPPRRLPPPPSSNPLESTGAALLSSPRCRPDAPAERKKARRPPRPRQPRDGKRNVFKQRGRLLSTLSSTRQHPLLLHHPSQRLHKRLHPSLHTTIPSQPSNVC